MLHKGDGKGLEGSDTIFVAMVTRHVPCTPCLTNGSFAFIL